MTAYSLFLAERYSFRSDLDVFSAFAAIKCGKIYKYIKVKRSYCRYNAQIGRRLNFSIRFDHTFCQNESQISL